VGIEFDKERERPTRILGRIAAKELAESELIFNVARNKGR
jgi:hypothetical protein